MPSPSSVRGRCTHRTSYEHHAAQFGTSADPSSGQTAALAASITAHDTVILTSDGHRLPGIPLPEAQQLNASRLKLEEQSQSSPISPTCSSNPTPETATFIPLVTNFRPAPSPVNVPKPPAYTHPLFPPLPLYGPATRLRRLQCFFLRVISGVFSTTFLLIVVFGAIFTGIPRKIIKFYQKYVKGIDPDKNRPFYHIEKEREIMRREKIGRRRRSFTGREPQQDEEKKEVTKETTLSKESTAKKNKGSCSSSNKKKKYDIEGNDKLICDVAYYAQRVGLDIEEYKVETEDGFLIVLQRVYDPRDPPLDMQDVEDGYGNPIKANKKGRRKYPILLMHGLLQSSGAFCVNDDDSLAFFLCKSGYDVWLGNNRCGFRPEHTLLTYSDPRMWAWNIRQMGILDIPAFVNHILLRTGFPKLALIAHSQGTTQTFVALAKEQHPDLGNKLSIFVALAPAVYAGRLVEDIYFKSMSVVSPSMFRIIFGIHAFIPIMMHFHKTLPGRIYGALGYMVFSFLFKWTDRRWDKGLRDRFFIFSPVYVSSESMRWWLGRECFATQKCILATSKREQEEDDESLRSRESEKKQRMKRNMRNRNNRNIHNETDSGNDKSLSSSSLELPEPQAVRPTVETTHDDNNDRENHLESSEPWYPKNFPPLALFICGSDDLVDGKRFLNRVRNRREPNVRLVFEKVIEEYEHLDVLWAVDAVEKVGKDVRKVVWGIVKEEMELGIEKEREKENNRKHEEKERGTLWWEDLVVPVTGT